MSDTDSHDEQDGTLVENSTAGLNIPQPRYRKKWTTEEDNALRRAIEKHNEGSWVNIAKDVPGRNAQQCLHRWTYTLNPIIKKGPWSAEEDRRLIELVGELGTEWTDIARLMGGRTGGQCLTRWRSHLNPTIKKGKWTEEEDALILEQRNKFARTWVEISKLLCDRCDADIRERYLWLIKPKIAKKVVIRKWTDEEDAILRRAVEENAEGNWEIVARNFPDRSVYQCYRRWHEGMNPNLKSGHWTPEEDARLDAMVKEHGPKWAVISRYMDGRTANRCRQRWSYHLNPALKKGCWTEEEDAIIVDRRNNYNMPWQEIGNYLTGRCGMDIKDRYNLITKARSKKKRPVKDTGDDILRHAAESESEDEAETYLAGQSPEEVLMSASVPETAAAMPVLEETVELEQKRPLKKARGRPPKI